MATIDLSWDNTAVNASGNTTGQRASKRVKAIGGAWDTAGFAPTNDMAKTVNSAVATILPNRVYEFKVEAICTAGGPTINDNGIQEGITFQCIGGAEGSPGDNPGELLFSVVDFDVNAPDINFVKFALYDNTNTTLLQTTAALPNASTISHLFTGLDPDAAYVVRVIYGALVNGVQVWSDFDAETCSYPDQAPQSFQRRVKIINNSLDVTLSTITLDGAALPTPPPYATPGNTTDHLINNDGTVDVFIEWATAIGGQSIYLQDSNGVVQACEAISLGDPTPNATWLGVDMTGPQELQIVVQDGAC